MPSVTSYIDKKAPQQFAANFVTLSRNFNFWALTLAFCCIYSIYQTLGAIISPLTAAFNYSSSYASLFGVVFIMSGLIGAFAHAKILDKYK